MRKSSKVRGILKVRNLFKVKMLYDRTGGTNIAIAAGTLILVVMVLGIIMGYMGGLGMQLTNSINDPSWANQTAGFINTAGNVGFSVLQFIFIIAIALVAFAIISLFTSRGEGGGGGV